MPILIPTWKLENFSSPANGFPSLYFDISFSVGSHHVVNVERGKLNRGHRHPGTVREQRGRIMGHESGLIIIDHAGGGC